MTTVRFPYPVMEFESATELPIGEHWEYEPKWDGFRCLAFRDGSRVILESKSGKPLDRYFPEVVERLASLRAKRFVLDGELVIPAGSTFSFDTLLLRIHPAASRIRKLAQLHPARYLVFDLLVDDRGESLVDDVLAERRRRLEQFARDAFSGDGIELSPATRDPHAAGEWLRAGAERCDGVIAKRVDLPYRGGERDGGVKVKQIRTADCVVGGFRVAKSGDRVGSLLLGLYDREGRLEYVGFASAFPGDERRALLATLEPLHASSSFTGRTPGGPSRWKPAAETVWQPLRPELVLEVAYDQVTGGRFRHGVRPLRWRPDKDPRSCTLAQLDRDQS